VTDETSTKGSAISRSLDILDAVATAQRPLAPAEICAQLQIPKATVHRLCTALEKRGLIEPVVDGRGYVPGRALHRMATGALASQHYYAERHAVLQALSRELGETCNIAIPDGSHMIYFDRAETHWPVRIQLPVGSHVPLYCTASGKMYMSTLPDARKLRILESLERKRLTGNTLVDVGALVNELNLIASRQYAIDREEYIDGMVALAVPIKDASGRLFATLSCHAPCIRVSVEDLEQFLSALRSAAAKFEAFSST